MAETLRLRRVLGWSAAVVLAMCLVFTACADDQTEQLEVGENIPTELTDLGRIELGRFSNQAEAKGYIVRVVSQDGVDLSVTADLRPNRVNVGVEKGTVVELRFIG